MSRHPPAETLRPFAIRSSRRGGAPRRPASTLPAQRIAPVVADADETAARWEMHPLATMAPLIRSCLAATADESRHLIVVSDAAGMLLWVEGNPSVRMHAADSMNFAEGALWSEGGAGTNAIGTALAAEHAVQVFASEHFNEVVQSWTCAAAPVHDPDTGHVIGVIDLTGEMKTVHPHSMAVATATVAGGRGAAALRDDGPRRAADRAARRPARRGPRAAGAAHAERARDRQPTARVAAGDAPEPAGRGRPVDARRRPLRWSSRRSATRRRISSARSRTPAAHGAARAPARCSRSRLLGRERGEAETAGTRHQLRLRHSEILTLLCANPDGMTSEELSLGIYGDPAGAGEHPGRGLTAAQAARRLHRTEHYRLAWMVGSDVAHVCALLHRGEVREAAARYPGPLLPELRGARRRPRAGGARAVVAPVGADRR